MRKIIFIMLAFMAINNVYAQTCRLGTWCQLESGKKQIFFLVSAAQGTTYSCTLFSGHGLPNQYVSAVIQGVEGFSFGPTTLMLAPNSFINGMVAGGFDASQKGKLVIYRSDDFELPATILCARLGAA